MVRQLTMTKLASLNLPSMAPFWECQHRGQEALVLAPSFDNKILTIKGKVMLKMYLMNKIYTTLKGNFAIGHNRYSTTNQSELDSQPLQVKYHLGEISVVHNGNLINKTQIREKLIKKGAIFQTQIDSENFIHLIAKSNKSNLEEKIIDALQDIKGAYNFIVLSNNQMYAIRDKHGIRPLCIGKLKSGGYIIASENCCFDLVDATFLRDVKPGEMIILKDNKLTSIELFTPDFRPCAFEYIYLARHDSTIDGKNVYEARLKMGEMLAKKNKIKADMVIGVPEGGIPCAIGFAKESKINYENAIVRNLYVGRTFIEPIQSSRELSVKMKFSIIKPIVKDKIIIVIDDSLVRGTTSKQIIKMLKDAKAKEVHLKIASPMVKFPCYYGIDTPTKEELIHNNKSLSQVKEYLGANSLEYLTIQELKQSINVSKKYSLPSFDGDYFIN